MMNLFYTFTQKTLALLFKLCYHHRVIIEDKTAFSKGAIIAANHLSFLDPPLIAASSPTQIAFFAKKALFKNPFLSFLIRRLNAHPVGGGSELTSLKIACDLLEQGHKILIFPEGTRSEDGTLKPFKRGIAMLAERTGAPIIPTYIGGTFGIWPKDRMLPCFLNKETLCVFGKPIYPEQFTENEDPGIVLRVEEEIRRLQQTYHPS
jgi:1-acyl-sn-glycerol-3-phosphate acyltransferase